MAANMWKTIMMIALIMIGCGLQACNGMNVDKSKPTMFNRFTCFRRCSITCSVDQSLDKTPCYKKCLNKCGLVLDSKPKPTSSSSSSSSS
ncbi:hypothetical protein ISN44_As05g024760, partial [Arabidopsis suecica]